MARFDADYKGIGLMLTAPWMIGDMRRRADATKVVCEATAPVYTRGPHPGRYKAAFRVESGIQGHRTRRAYGEVINDAPEALAVEYGNVNTPQHRTMFKALIATAGR